MNSHQRRVFRRQQSRRMLRRLKAIAWHMKIQDMIQRFSDEMRRIVAKTDAATAKRVADDQATVNALCAQEASQ